MLNYKELSIDELQKLTSQGDCEACYWLGDNYFNRGDYRNAAELWERVVKEVTPSMECFKRAACNLSLLHQDGLHPKSDDNEAIRLYELVLDKGPISMLALGLLYCEVQGENHDTNKGIRIVEDTIQWFIKEDGNDEYLSNAECFRISRMYYKEARSNNKYEYIQKASEYAQKTIARCGNHQNDIKRAEMARVIIEECRSI